FSWKGAAGPRPARARTRTQSAVSAWSTPLSCKTRTNPSPISLSLSLYLHTHSPSLHVSRSRLSCVEVQHLSHLLLLSVSLLILSLDQCNRQRWRRLLPLQALVQRRYHLGEQRRGGAARSGLQR